jgi:hypothetical protein
MPDEKAMTIVIWWVEVIYIHEKCVDEGQIGNDIVIP